LAVLQIHNLLALSFGYIWKPNDVADVLSHSSVLLLIAGRPAGAVYASWVRCTATVSAISLTEIFVFY
jgi:hypothetical protein